MAFSFSRDKAFAKELADQLVKQLPPGMMDAKRQALSVNKVTRQLEKTYTAAADYQREQRIGFIRRAFLANGFRWELKTAGYPDDFVDVAVEGLVVELSRAPRAPGSTS